MTGRNEITPELSGVYYLVVKAGSCCEGNLDVSFDSISLRDDAGGELVVNGEFGSSNGWSAWTASAPADFDFFENDPTRVPSGGAGPALRMSGATNNGIPQINGGIYQAIELEAGRTYSFSGVFRDNGSANAWAEILLVETEPRDGVDVVGDEALPGVNFATADIAEIEMLFESFGTIDYEVHEELRTALTATEPSTLYTLPSPPEGLTVTLEPGAAQLSWRANPEADVTGYNVYRSDGSSPQFRLLGENVASPSFRDDTIDDSTVYTYRVAAVDAEDVSYPSAEVPTGSTRLTIPGRIEAETFTRNLGFQLESTTDVGGGLNTGFADPGDFLEYDVTIADAGTYTIDYRVASLPGSQGFTVSIDGEVIDTVVVNETGGWQSWVTISQTIELPAGEQTLRIDSVGREWNMNWFDLY